MPKNRLLKVGVFEKYRYHDGITYLVFLIVLIIYVITRNKHVNFGDSLSFLLFAVEGFDLATNATSHFLYNNLNHIMILIFPENQIESLTFLSIGFSILTLVQVYRISLLITGNTLSASLGMIILAFSFTYWRQSVIIEVYTFNTFLIATLEWLIIRDLFMRDSKHMLWVGLLLGVSLWVHIQNILFIPAFCYYLWIIVPNIRKQTIIAAIGLFLLASLVLFIPPIFLNTNTITSIFFDNHFNKEVLGIQLIPIVKGFAFSLVFLGYNFHVFLFLILPGIRSLYKDHTSIVVFLGMVAIPYWLFFMRYRVSDNYVFYLIPYISVSIIISVGLREIIKKTQWNPQKYLLYSGLIILMHPIIYFIVCKGASTMGYIQKFSKEHAYKGGIKYYCWPGMEQSKNPLYLAKEHYVNTQSDSIPPLEAFDRYPEAIRYLKLTGEIE